MIGLERLVVELTALRAAQPARWLMGLARLVSLRDGAAGGLTGPALLG